MGFNPSGVSPLEEVRHLTDAALPSWRFSCSPRLRKDNSHWRPPTNTRRYLPANHYPPSGSCSPRESVHTGQTFKSNQWSVPSWASPSLGLSPSHTTERPSPSLLPCASPMPPLESYPSIRCTDCASECPSCGAVAFSLSRAPCPSEVSRLRSTCQLGRIPGPGYRFSSEPRWRHRSFWLLFGPSVPPTGV